MSDLQTANASAPEFRLREEGTVFGLDTLRAEAAELAADLRQSAGQRIAVSPGRLHDLLVALFASEMLDCDLLLLRRTPTSDTEELAREHHIAALLASNKPLEVFTANAESNGEADILLMTSGTTGKAKLVRHTRARLLAAIQGSLDAQRDWNQTRWLLTYPPPAFAGLQVILTALLAGATLVAPTRHGIAEITETALAAQVTHISGTPTFWRAFLLALRGRSLPLRGITLGGEAADQTTLDRLAEVFPGARIRHVYASSEAGTVFSVGDGQAGFPAAWLDDPARQPALRLRNDALQIKSRAAMLAYDGGEAAGEWIDSGDLVRIEGDRCLFAGRRDSQVNVGGVKVSPEAVETRLLALPEVWDAVVEPRANPISGAILTARVQPSPAASGLAPEELKRRIAETLSRCLEPAARPRIIEIVDEIGYQGSGKKSRMAAGA